MTRPGRRPGAPLPAAAIREASASGASDDEIAAEHQADRTTISRIVRGITQPKAGGPVRVTQRPGRPAVLPLGPIATLSVELPLELRDRIDAVRGRESRSAWVRRAAVELLERAADTPIIVVIDEVPVQCRTVEDAVRLRTFAARYRARRTATPE